MVVNQILCGDALQTLRTLPSESVHCIVTSPPYYALRDYGVDGQIGLEETPAAFVQKLVEVFHEARRVLRSDGTLWLNIGDTYAGGSRGRDDSGDGGKFAGPRIERKDNAIPAGFKKKDLMMIPARLAIALQENGWWLRSEIIWNKPSAMPEPMIDRPSRSHEQIYLLAKSEHYYYDAEAVREPAIYGENRATFRGGGIYTNNNSFHNGKPIKGDGEVRERPKTTTRNKRDVWTVSGAGYAEAHFATFPPKLIEPCILAGSPPDGVVLDPFMGAGTVALVSIRLQRQYLGIELNPDYVALAEKRIAEVQPTLWADAAAFSGLPAAASQADLGTTDRYLVVSGDDVSLLTTGETGVEVDCEVVK